MQHSRKKPIEVCHYFVYDHVKKGNVSLSFVPMENQPVDIFTKPLSSDHFSYISIELDMLNEFA